MLENGKSTNLNSQRIGVSDPNQSALRMRYRASEALNVRKAMRTPIQKRSIMRLSLAVFTILLGVITVHLMFIRSSSHGIDDKSVWGQGTAVELTKQTKFKLSGIAAGLRVYRKLHGNIPANGVDLIQELNRGKVSLARCAETMLDSWGNQIIYTVQNSNAVLTSAGADNKFATEDDIMLQVDIFEGSNTIWGYSEEMTLEKSLKVFSP